MAFVHEHPVLAAALAALCSAALLLIGNGMDPVWPVMWVAFVPILLFAAASPSWIISAAVTAIAMLLGSLHMLRYLRFAIKAPLTAWLVPFSIASALFTIGVLLFRALLRRGNPWSAMLVFPAFWTVCEFAASFVPANGTAGSLAYTQERFLPLLQVVSITGPWGITFLLLVFQASVVAAICVYKQSPAKAMLLAGSSFLLVATALLFGSIRLAVPQPRETMQVGLLDTDAVIFAHDQASMLKLADDYATQAERLAHQGARLVVMPEKIGLLLASYATTFDSVFQSTADRSGATLVIGVEDVFGANSFNQARVYVPHEPVATYDKQHMLPPFESYLTPGSSLTMLAGQPALVGVAVCKDMDFVHPALDYARAGAGLMLDPAWDINADRVWHGHIAIMRGVEGGFAIAHAAKNGLLTVTDNRGRILSEVPTSANSFTSTLVDVPLRHDQTLFDRFGTWFPWLSAALFAITSARLLSPSSEA